MKDFQRVSPEGLKKFNKEPLSQDEKFKIAMRALIKGFLLLSIPGFLVGIGIGWLIWG